MYSFFIYCQDSYREVVHRVVANDSLWCTEGSYIEWWWLPTTDCGASRGGASRMFASDSLWCHENGCQRRTVMHRGVVHRRVGASDSRWCTESNSLRRIIFLKVILSYLFKVLSGLLSGVGASRGGCQRVTVVHRVVVHRGAVAASDSLWHIEKLCIERWLSASHCGATRGGC